MKKEIRIKIGTDGNVSMASYCLRTDFWHDYLAFVQDTETSVANGDIRTSNRYLRAALTCLFAHLEGVTKAIEDRCTIPVVYDKGRLCDRTLNIGLEARKYGQLPRINFRFGKHLRDLIAHPGIEKFFEGDTLDQGSVFEKLDVSTLRALQAQISPWLDAVCRNLGVERLTDTKAQAEEDAMLLAEIYGGGDSQITEV